MRSHAAIGKHPVHPAFVSLPIGCFFLLFVGDVAQTLTHQPFWYRFSFVCLGAGILTALVAALFGFIDYFTVKMSAAAGRTATIHMVINLVGVVLYTVNFFVRRDSGALNNDLWPLAFGLEVVTFLALGVSGWLGGKLVFHHEVGVIEEVDPEAARITHQENPLEN
ncbi:MAG TPA: DUF2231 domain-containing protein [Thermoanaerobaculia bacterium]|nr:DUF2231 domain-containing protein [Thermoanaerobaculia bacterium]